MDRNVAQSVAASALQTARDVAQIAENVHNVINGSGDDDDDLQLLTDCQMDQGDDFILDAFQPQGAGICVDDDLQLLDDWQVDQGDDFLLSAPQAQRSPIQYARNVEMAAATSPQQMVRQVANTTADILINLNDSLTEAIDTLPPPLVPLPGTMAPLIPLPGITPMSASPQSPPRGQYSPPRDPFSPSRTPCPTSPQRDPFALPRGPPVTPPRRTPPRDPFSPAPPVRSPRVNAALNSVGCLIQDLKVFTKKVSPPVSPPSPLGAAAAPWSGDMSFGEAMTDNEINAFLTASSSRLTSPQFCPPSPLGDLTPPWQGEQDVFDAKPMTDEELTEFLSSSSRPAAPPAPAQPSSRFPARYTLDNFDETRDYVNYPLPPRPPPLQTGQRRPSSQKAPAPGPQLAPPPPPCTPVAQARLQQTTPMRPLGSTPRLRWTQDHLGGVYSAPPGAATLPEAPDEVALTPDDPTQDNVRRRVVRFSSENFAQVTVPMGYYFPSGSPGRQRPAIIQEGYSVQEQRFPVSAPRPDDKPCLSAIKRPASTGSLGKLSSGATRDIRASSGGRAPASEPVTSRMGTIRRPPTTSGTSGTGTVRRTLTPTGRASGSIPGPSGTGTVRRSTTPTGRTPSATLGPSGTGAIRRTPTPTGRTPPATPGPSLTGAIRRIPTPTRRVPASTAGSSGAGTIRRTTTPTGRAAASGPAGTEAVRRTTDPASRIQSTRALRRPGSTPVSSRRTPDPNRSERTPLGDQGVEREVLDLERRVHRLELSDLPPLEELSYEQSFQIRDPLNISAEARDMFNGSLNRVRQALQRLEDKNLELSRRNQ